MEIIKNTEFGGERPLFGAENLELEGVTIHAGESALKNCRNIYARDCRFEGKYPFWHVDGFQIDHCLFTPGARAALWYSTGVLMQDTQVDAPKMFREMDGVDLRRVNIPDAQETLWHCRKIQLRDVKVENADYIFMHCENINIQDYEQHGNYSFQYARNAVIRNARIFSKDAFWQTEDVTVYDSELQGEYLGWHSRRLRLVRCHITGTQPLCYAHDLILEDCTFGPDCDLAFEDASLHANIRGGLVSIKNPKSGRIEIDSVGEIIKDKFVKVPDNCEIIIRQ